MKYTVQDFLSEKDRDQIREAVKTAESQTSGEIKVLVVEKSSAFWTRPFLNLSLFKKMREKLVEKRAVREFSGMNISSTAGKTGILVMISLAERMVNIKADKAINNKVEQAVWDGMAGDLVSSIKGGKPVDGILSVLKKSGELLSRNFPKAKDDINEVTDDVEIKK